MSPIKEVVDDIRRLNAQKSTGPKTPAGKQRARFNAAKHNLSGQNLILQEPEFEAYNRLSAEMLEHLNPKTEPERQIAVKIIDTNFRLNRLPAIENNMFSFGIVENEHGDSDNEDRIEVMGAQSRAWIQHHKIFDTLGRYEARLQRQLLKYQQELERLQAVRQKQEWIDDHRTDEEIELERTGCHSGGRCARQETDSFNPASFMHASPGPNGYKLLSHLPPPKGWVKPLPEPEDAPENAPENGDQRKEELEIRAEIPEKRAA